MATIAAHTGNLEDVPLRLKLRRVERRQKLKAFILVLPLLLFVLTTFVLPIGRMMFNAVHDNTLLKLMPRTMRALDAWDGSDLPGEAVYAALAGDLKESSAQRTASVIGKRINYELPGSLSEVISSARKVSKLSDGPYREALIETSPLWGQHGVWSLLKRGTSAYTGYYLLRSVDYQYSPDSRIVASPPENAIFRDVFLRTLGISIAVSVVTLLLGFPVAYLLATLPRKSSNLLMILVVLPFWTSVLVRTTAWVVLLQQHGVVNDTLMALHVISQPAELIYNRIGTIVAMSHIQLPVTLLPIYSVMKTISPIYVRAARSLGAGPFYAFWKVYFPQTLPGIAAGCLLTFILCLGYYITPALVGGPADQMVSSFVAHYTNEELSWGMASALGAILLTATLLLYYFFNKLVGVDRIKMG
ncbi:ABC transporter permease [Bradyrhizobium canariense]|uniref:ABC transporter permease n=1 Tax=Bradyrhizobium canariense TaxID=255045 RepID=UPI000A18FE4D|nr:ABC transporter permease [Bradyrhizobium canariense]OSI30602.1 ABC transporter permease [Bradyrhizobium canariense]OSI37322.1 ABC transporter permease [Bradyrhizobium canariense]OSI52044.1 ABC transporter permease [Bradyrhizobium canariense]OSI56348.1 ABC transporter permease [Bradyrhizobium canariense]OSI59416.1 ABC transporter permease [Bradyrhizobium canariense]